MNTAITITAIIAAVVVINIITTAIRDIATTKRTTPDDKENSA